jgi:hypothetical protein
MSVIDSAPPSNPLSLKDANPAMFTMRDSATAPATVTVAGSSNLELIPLEATATGTVKAAVPGMLVMTLLGASKGDVSTEIGDWLPLGSCAAEPIGGATDLPETMWMVRGRDLMIFSGSGKMQGTFDCNVAGRPAAPVDLEHHPDDITPVDPLYVFAVAAQFTPDAAGDGTAELCSVKLHSLTIGG